VRRVEDLLREEFQRPDPGVPASRDQMLARVARARRRRSVAVAGLATVAVGVAAAGVLLGLNGPSGQSVGAEPDIPQYTGELVNMIFTDTSHGFALQQYCSLRVPAGELPSGAPTPDVHRQCQSQLLETTDGGRNWEERTMPAEPATKDAGVDIVEGHSLMLWMAQPGTLALGSWDRRYWTTTDGGRTWRESGTPRDTGPAGSMAYFGTADQLAFLATYPPDRGPSGHPLTKNFQLSTASDGSVWIACVSEPCVRVTHDQGKTWETRLVGGAAGGVDWVASGDGTTVYAGLREDGLPARLVRSTNSGQSWTTLPAVTLRANSTIALPNGDLIMAEASLEGGLYRLKAGATAVEKLPGGPAHAAVLYRTGGVLVAATVWAESDEPALNSVVSISTDGGSTWRSVPAPGAA
jgi:hypothetical protein